MYSWVVYFLSYFISIFRERRREKESRVEGGIVVVAELFKKKFYVNSFLCTVFFTIIIIKYKVSFSSHSSSSHYSMQGFIFISFHPFEGFLGGLSLHLNHLIASCAANYNWPFGTLPFGLFCSNLDTRDLETYTRTHSGHFWNMSIFDDSRAVWVLFRKWVVSENQSFLDEGAIITPLIGLVLGGEVLG